jgi:hypothetical protein
VELSLAVRLNGIKCYGFEELADERFDPLAF